MRIFPEVRYQQELEVERIAVVMPTYSYFHVGTRTFLEQVIKGWKDIGEQWNFRLLMVLDELVTNAIEYGSGEGDEVSIALYYKAGAWLEIVVEDSGRGRDPKTAVQMDALLAQKKQEECQGVLALRGRGLAKIVASWTDSLSFHDREGGGLLVCGRKYIV